MAMIISFSNTTTYVRYRFRMLSDTYIVISFIEMAALNHKLRYLKG